ncbi:MAG: SpoIIE family protein phosphatase [Chloroflexi bacterium]|nr:SpoIIE family protein phosphatase [Chloroflexota bacterium]
MTDSVSSFGIMNALDCGYFEVDLKGIMINANQSFLTRVQLPLAGMIGKHYRHMVDVRQVVDLYKAFNRVYKNKGLERVRFTYVRHKTGGFRTAEGVIGALEDLRGNVIGFRGVLFDITEQVKKESDLLAAKQAAENELAIGRNIQYSFLPTNFLQVEGWNLDVRFHSAREVAGDFYDVFPMSNGVRLGFVVADVCDKGVGAAMYMAIFRTLIRAFANVNVATNLTKAFETVNEPGITESMFIRRQKTLAVGAQPLMNAVQMTNNYIAQIHGNSNMFATIFMGVLNPQDGKLLYVNGGHEPPLVISNGQVAARLEPTGPAVGLMPDLPFSLGEYELKPNDLLFAYTDGVVDARDSKGRSFTEERMLAEIEQHAGDPGMIVHRIMESLNSHIDDQDQFDDITLLGLFRK